MFRIFFIVLAFCALSFSAQVVLPTTESAFETQHNFNPVVIKAKGIKRIVFEILDKRDFEVAVDKSLTEVYEFNPNGKLSRFYFTTIVRTHERQISKTDRRGNHYTQTIPEYIYDTISTTYFYSQEGNLILKRYHDGVNYYESRYYRYDSLGNLTKELRFKETNNSPNKGIFILGNQVLLSEDSFQYKKFSSGQLRCTYLNNENRSYKEKITNFDKTGHKLKEEESYTAASWIRQENTFEYQGDRLTIARFEGNAHNKVVLKNTYEYDDINELYSEKQYKNDLLLREISYVTNRNDSLLNSIVIRDPINKTMRIVKLRYEFGLLTKLGH